MTNMTNNTHFDYFRGEESTQYQFYSMPKALMKDPRFKSLSNDAKLLYTLMLDRMSLSARNGWYDQGRVYIYFTLNEVQEVLNCGSEKGMKLLAELDTTRGVGLIERVKQGQGKPTKIFVKRFISQETPEPDHNSSELDKAPDTGSVRSEQVHYSAPGLTEYAVTDCGKPNCNKTDRNKTDYIQTYQSIYQSCQRPEKQRADRNTPSSSEQPPSAKVEPRTVPRAIHPTPEPETDKNKSHRAIYFLDKQDQKTVLHPGSGASCAAASASMSFVTQTTLVGGKAPKPPKCVPWDAFSTAHRTEARL